MTTNKKKYINLCKTEKTIPIFSQAFWLNAVVESNNWDVAIVENNDHKIIGAMPYIWKKKYGFKILTMPKLTQTLGPWLRYPENQKYCSKLSFEKKIMAQLIEQLPKFNYFTQNFHYSITNWLPFYWKKFQQTTQYTYIIEDLTNLGVVLGRFDHSKTKNIKRAEQIITVKTDMLPREFYENHKHTLKKQNKMISYSYDLFDKIYNATHENKQSKIFYAIDKKNNLHSAIFVIWDNTEAYDLISTIDPDYRNSGATSLLIKTAIEYTSKIVTKFNFEGSMIEEVEKSFRRFGAIQKPYFNITKASHILLKIGTCLKDILK